MDGRCPLDLQRLKNWLDDVLGPFPSRERSDPFATDHWDQIDPSWKMPWYRARDRLPHGIAVGGEWKFPGYSFTDAVVVFLTVRDLLPFTWKGIIEVVIPLEDSLDLSLVAPELDNIVPDYRTPPSVYLFPEPVLARTGISIQPWEGFSYVYPTIPSCLPIDSTNVLFQSSWAPASRRDHDETAGNRISIRGLPR